jgi:general secretion pathway protein G
MERNIPAGDSVMRFKPFSNFRDRCRGARGIRKAGFTLLELMIVLTIIMILAAIAGERYDKSVQQAREATLKQDLFIMRTAIQNYTLDKAAGPSSLDDLVSAKYISSIPTDPMTRNKDWHTDSDEVLLTPEQTSVGITDVHSASTAISPFMNTPYSTW